MAGRETIPIRVMFLNPFPGLGGSERGLLELLATLPPTVPNSFSALRKAWGIEEAAASPTGGTNE